ncbi:four-carbon acid sugar kinase family protein [Glaciimonas sp. CA11.2]|uniref:3-oxo-tetronate kinase n=1 Tax=unclassified Glaciimonas TaxID=2644401 RepID=UPI002AB41AD3|nr:MULTISPECIES: 3-oxo-tetronate kinase [unclassified Glaciimonas]MDY7545175.1 four-carbon acid sugar kinase family protein [Glaciimonas sp. CA11.2]MEB0011327.1 four-carbon acid sugar kinase family protein [Glaciimonas sp. Cout2]MEB0080977.1 four-carbon acid sugar kinase family protein [Glaciimonas sp. Gout2]MEB0162310.1 four-carbon acid sugar kinase family protein [Glaciimonas sp. CA11.2]
MSSIANPANKISQPLLGCIADDFTGATDLANMLVREGMRTVQTIGVPDVAPTEVDAIVVALKSRTIPANQAVAESLAALAWLQKQGCRQFFFKYCSTFDSTAQGNIGQVTDALLDALGADFTLACPVFPETGRTLYRGHLFINDQLLNESGMQNHPLTPMTDANLVRVLQQQTTGTVGLVGYPVVAQGVEAIQAEMASLHQRGVRMAIVDALVNADLYAIGAACAGLPLVTGGSGIALGLPGNFVRAGLLNTSQNVQASALPTIDGWSVVLAGSASLATNAQVGHWKEKHPAFRIDALAVARGEPVVANALAFAQEHLSNQAPLIYATTTSEQVKQVQAELGVERAGALIEDTLAEIASGLFALGVRRFVVAGGETSGAVVKALNVTALRIGKQIDPGVPATASIGDVPLALALKSGNFGTVDFFEKALRQLGDERIALRSGAAN